MCADHIKPIMTQHRDSSFADLQRLIRSPFERLRELLVDVEPGYPPIDMTLGEPRHGVPALLGPALQGETAGYGKYPSAQGTAELVGAIAGWLERRYPAIKGTIVPTRHILPLNGSREGLFSAIFPAIARKISWQRPAVLMPNPFYHAYLATAIAGGAEPVLLAAEERTGFLPDLDAIHSDILARTVAFYLASPANPQGVVANAEYLAKAIGLARAHDFMLFLDECYCEIYRGAPPVGGLEVAHALSGNFANVAVFNSLSKRSNVPGLRSGFVAGDECFTADYFRLRNLTCALMPLPVQHASALLWSDEEHVEASRALYQQKFDAARSLLGKQQGYA